MHVYWMEIKTELLKLGRMRRYVFFTVLFPVMFYCFFGLAMNQNVPAGAMGGMPPMARYLLATYGAFGMIGATLYAFGVGIAVERGLGWRQLKIASPMPPAAYLVAKAVGSLFFGCLVVALLFALGAFFGVRMAPIEWVSLGLTLVVGTIPFCALGIAIGSVVGPNSAPAGVNMVYLPLAFLGGLWMPYDFMPPGIQSVAQFMPTFHFAQLALGAMGAPAHGSAASHVEALAAFALIFAGAAWLLSARESEKMYG
jgi:ABC-2 type transport system permease protein